MAVFLNKHFATPEMCHSQQFLRRYRLAKIPFLKLFTWQPQCVKLQMKSTQLLLQYISGDLITLHYIDNSCFFFLRNCTFRRDNTSSLEHSILNNRIEKIRGPQKFMENVFYENSVVFCLFFLIRFTYFFQKVRNTERKRSFPKIPRTLLCT